MSESVPKGIELGKVGYLGPKHTFTHVAGRGIVDRYYPGSENPDSPLVGMKNNLGVIKAVSEGKVDSGVVTIQNLYGGRVPDVVAGLYEFAKSHNVRIVDSINVPITMCIGGVCDSEKVNKVASKDVALQQCSKYLEQHHPNAEWEYIESTARGMELVAAREPRYEFAAALGARQGFEEFGIDIFDEDIANVTPNKTRFLLIKSGKIRHGRSKKGTTDVTTVAVEPCRTYRNLSGELLDLANDCGTVVKYVYTKPTGTDYETVFLDIIGHRSEKNVQLFLSKLKQGSIGKKTDHVLLGCYPFYEFFEPNIRRIGIVGGTAGLNKLVGDFYTNCGYDTHVARDDEKSIKFVARNSDVIVVNRAGRKRLVKILPMIKDYLGSEKLLVINSSNPNHVKQGMSDVKLDANILFMDAPVAKKAPITGQNVIFIGDVDLTPGSIQSEFVAVYDGKKANVSFTDFDTHKLYRDFSTEGLTLASLFYVDLARRLGIDFGKLGDFTSPPEAILADLARKTVAYNPDVVSNHLQRFLHDKGGVVKACGEGISKTPDLSEDDIRKVIQEAIDATTDIHGAIERVTSLYRHMHGPADL